MIITPESIAALNVGFKTSFQNGIAAAMPQWSEIATLVPSSHRSETYGWLGQFPMLREWIGDRQIKAMQSHSYSIVNRKFESTIEVLRDDIDDDAIGIYAPMFTEMGRAAAVHPDELVYSLLAQGDSSLCYDGQNFFDTDHPVGVPGQTDITSASNWGGGSGAMWVLADTSRPLKPLIYQRRRDYDLRILNDLSSERVFLSDKFLYGVDSRVNAGFGFWQQVYGSRQALNQANFEAAIASIKSLKSDEGNYLNLNPTKLFVGPSNEAAANATVKVARLASGADNPNYNRVQVVVVPWLG